MLHQTNIMIMGVRTDNEPVYYHGRQTPSLSSTTVLRRLLCSSASSRSRIEPCSSSGLKRMPDCESVSNSAGKELEVLYWWGIELGVSSPLYHASEW